MRVRFVPHSRLFLAVVVVGSLSVVWCRPSPAPVGRPPFVELDDGAGPFPEVVFLRQAAKRRLAREFADGRRSLLTTAALFRELDRLPPAVPPVPSVDPKSHSIGIPGRTEEERFCRQVIAWVEFPGVPPDQIPAAVLRLEAEFWEALEREGAIRLPDPSTLEPVEELLKRVPASLAKEQRRTALGDFKGD
jgi:hypothetical protein